MREPGERGPAWWGRQGLRARLALTTTAGLALALLMVAWLFAFTVKRSLIGTMDGSLRRSARDVAALVDAGRLPDPVLVTGGATTVQVVDVTGRIRAASPGADRLVPLLDVPARRDPRARFLDGRPLALPGRVRVVSAPTRGGQTVIAAAPYDQVQDNVATVERALLVGTPALLVLLAGAGWLVTGGALRPIDELRRGAEEITETARSRRLPVPPARDEVHALAVTLNAMLARLEAAEARQRALVSDSAHELRSPLAGIRTQLEVAIDHPEEQDWPDTAQGVLTDTLRLSRLADDLLVLARIGERPPARTRVDLAALAREDRFASRARVAADGPVTVLGDPARLARVLGNLIDNAARHAASRIEVSVRAAGARAVLTVTDDGPGIAPADRDRVFERFTRLDEGRGRDEGGAGLGLAIVRETARAHGGDAHLEDAGPGLRAVVRLPLAPA